MNLSVHESITLRALVKTELNKSKARKVEMYADADDNFSYDLYWENRINELERILEKL